MKKLLIIGVLILISVGGASAGITTSVHYEFDGNGLPEYPNEGIMTTYIQLSNVVNSGDIWATVDYEDLGTNTIYIQASGTITASSTLSKYAAGACKRIASTTGATYVDLPYQIIPAGGIVLVKDSYQEIYSVPGHCYLKSYGRIWGTNPASITVVNVAYISPNVITSYNISGTTCDIDHIDLYMEINATSHEYQKVNYTSSLNVLGDEYNFSVIEDVNYRLEAFNDSVSIEVFDFSLTGDTTHDFDYCCYYELAFFDDCSNALINPYTTIYKNEFIPVLLYQGYDNPIKLLIDTDIELGDDIDITLYTCDGDKMLNDPCVEDRTRNIYHQDISWDMDIHVIDDNTGADISPAKVTRTQDCCIIGEPSGYALTQSNGRVCFTGLANSNINITVEKSGYVTHSTTIGVGNCFNCQSEGAQFTVYLNSTTGNSTDDFNNGTHNDSENIDGTDEETLPSDHGFGCGVYFKNVDGYIVGSIYDTDAYVDMYWWVKNHDGGDSNLKFQYQMYTHWYDAQTYTVSNNTYEYRRIYNADFNDHTNSYRGYIYNTTEGCNDIQTLTVLNHTYENETNYRNLTSHCHFVHKLGGNEIDYRSNVEIKIYANSDNSTLLGITANLMNGSTLVDSITYNWADFTNGDPKWWVVWEPTYDYTSGYNYTANITGFDGYQLDTDEVWTSNLVGNTLTVNVKDNHGTPLTHSTVFVEGWGSQASGTSSTVPIIGVSNGDVQYRATKSGYISSSWATTTLSDNDESVTCILVKASSTIATGVKLNDSEIKAFFIPCMYLLFILILVGGVTNAVKK